MELEVSRTEEVGKLEEERREIRIEMENRKGNLEEGLEKEDRDKVGLQSPKESMAQFAYGTCIEDIYMHSW